AIRVEDPVQVARMDAPPLLVAHVLGVQRVAADTCAADEHVELRQALDGRVQLRGVADVVALREVEDMHVRTPLAKTLHCSSADATRAARDEGDAAGKVVMVGHRLFLYGFVRELRSEPRLPA